MVCAVVETSGDPCEEIFHEILQGINKAKVNYRKSSVNLIFFWVSSKVHLFVVELFLFKKG